MAIPPKVGEEVSSARFGVVPWKIGGEDTKPRGRVTSPTFSGPIWPTADGGACAPGQRRYHVRRNAVGNSDPRGRFGSGPVVPDDTTEPADAYICVSTLIGVICGSNLFRTATATGTSFLIRDLRAAGL